MNKKIKKWIRKEKRLWHKHFIPSLLAGVIVAVLALLFKANLPNIILFGSVGASAAILTNSHSHHLTGLRTSLIGYVIAIIFSGLLYIVNQYIKIDLSINIFLVIFSVTIAQFLMNSFHPPAIGASLSFVLLKQDAGELTSLFVTILILLILVRLFTYIFTAVRPSICPLPMS